MVKFHPSNKKHIIGYMIWKRFFNFWFSIFFSSLYMHGTFLDWHIRSNETLHVVSYHFFLLFVGFLRKHQHVHLLDDTSNGLSTSRFNPAHVTFVIVSRESLYILSDKSDNQFHICSDMNLPWINYNLGSIRCKHGLEMVSGHLILLIRSLIWGYTCLQRDQTTNTKSTGPTRMT